MSSAPFRLFKVDGAKNDLLGPAGIRMRYQAMDDRHARLNLAGKMIHKMHIDQPAHAGPGPSSRLLR